MERKGKIVESRSSNALVSDMIGISLTRDNELIRVPLEKEELGPSRPSSKAMHRSSTSLSIAYPEIISNGNFIGAEMAMSYQPAGFVKIPRSLFMHSGWIAAKPKHQFIFLQFLFRAAWAPTCFYWYGDRIDLLVGQLYFSRRKLSEELSTGNSSDDKISESDIRGAVRYFEKCNFLTQGLTQGLTHTPTVITILFSEFCDEKNKRPNPGSNPGSNPSLTHPSPTKEEDKEYKEEKKIKSPAAPASADAERLCSNFIEMLSKTLPVLKIPANLAKWQAEFDLMLTKDKCSVKDIEFLFEKMPGHFYSVNVQCPRKFREKFPVLMGYHTQSQEVNQTNINRSWFMDTKKDKDNANIKALKDWTASGDYVLNGRNSKEISLKMGHSEFKKAFLAAIGGRELG